MKFLGVPLNDMGGYIDFERPFFVVAMPAKTGLETETYHVPGTDLVYGRLKKMVNDLWQESVKCKAHRDD